MLKLLTKTKLNTSIKRLPLMLRRFSTTSPPSPVSLQLMKKHNTNMNIWTIANNTNNKFAFFLNVVEYSLWFAFLIFFINYSFLSVDRNPKPSEQPPLPKFKDVIGNEQVKKDLKEIVDFLKNPEPYRRMNAIPPKGILMEGPPGVGKTLLAKALAGEANVTFFNISGSDIEKFFVGTGTKKIKKIFKTARSKSPAIIFIDEIDAIGAERNSVNHQSLNQLLSEMDGFQDSSGVIVIGATNMVSKLDKALLRSGRFDRIVKLFAPDHVCRKQMFDYFLRKKRLVVEVDTKKLSEESVGLTGADIENVVNSAAIEAVKKKTPTLRIADLREALKIFTMGRVKKNFEATEEFRRETACHEAGHTIAALFGKTPSRVAEVSILPRGRALGVTSQAMTEDAQFTTSYEELLSKLDVLMGGLAAEEMVYGPHKVTSGTSDDLQKATNLVNRILTISGMGKTLGKMSLSGNTSHLLTDDIQRKLDDEVKKILDESYERSKKVLCDRREEFDRVVEALMAKNTLDDESIQKAITA